MTSIHLYALTCLVVIALGATTFSLSLRSRVLGAEYSLDICKRDQSITKPGNNSFIDHHEFRFSLDRSILHLETPSDKKAIPLRQPDYGTTYSIHLLANGAIIALGDQISWLIDFGKKPDDSSYLKAKRLEQFFVRKCSTIDHMLGNCSISEPQFSAELNAVFLSGFNKQGEARSLVYGLTKLVSDISSSPQPTYLFDLPGSGKAVLGGQGAKAIFDGYEFTPCTE